MTTLVLRLTGPLQSWGTSRFVHRQTRHEPTKSGVLGLLAAADGRRRTAPIEDLAELRFGVRVEQPPRLVRDFQTARSPDGKRIMPLSYRHYLADAVYLAAVEGERPMLEGLLNAVRRPTYPLYLGRRSCPPAGPLSAWLRDDDLVEALHTQEWHASTWHKRTKPGQVSLEIFRDAAEGDHVAETVRDLPVSFDPERREYGWRDIVHEDVTVANELAPRAEAAATRTPTSTVLDHDPFAAL
jgi:CRISPR system Cascade subunit CasD